MKFFIIQIYEKLIDKDATAVFGDLFEKAKLYNRIIAPDDETSTPTVAQQFRDLERIGGASAYVLLLYLLADRPTTDLVAISKFLVKFLVRRNLTDLPPTRDLARNFISLIEVLRSRPEANALGIIEQEFTSKGWIASTAFFREKLAGNLYEENVNATRFVLCSIEEAHQTREKFTELWKRDSRGDFIWTVEHIFPQGANIPAAWVQVIGNGDQAQAKALRDQHVHMLGNLTLTGHNSKLGNKSFTEKRDRKDSSGTFVGYKNGMHLNATLREHNSWSVPDIQSRTNILVAQALKLFAIGTEAHE